MALGKFYIAVVGVWPLLLFSRESHTDGQTDASEFIISLLHWSYAVDNIISVYQLIKTWLRFFSLTLVNLNSHWKLLEHGVLQSAGWQSHSQTQLQYTAFDWQTVSTRLWYCKTYTNVDIFNYFTAFTYLGQCLILLPSQRHSFCLCERAFIDFP